MKQEAKNISAWEADAGEHVEENDERLSPRIITFKWIIRHGRDLFKFTKAGLSVFSMVFVPVL